MIPGSSIPVDLHGHTSTSVTETRSLITDTARQTLYLRSCQKTREGNANFPAQYAQPAYTLSALATDQDEIVHGTRTNDVTQAPLVFPWRKLTYLQNEGFKSALCLRHLLWVVSLVSYPVVLSPCTAVRRIQHCERDHAYLPEVGAMLPISPREA